LVLAFEERDSSKAVVLGNGSDPRMMVVRAAAKAGLKDVSPHVLRHTAATHMARAGKPLWKIAKILGNTIDVVERVYAKHCPDDLRDTVNSITGGAVEMAK
jgi:integrase